MSGKIKSRERTAILQSLRAGVVPRIGLRHIQVGRKDEVEAILKDLARIEDDSANIRFIIGKFGSGKSFFLNLTEMIALERKFVVVRADITTDRRLHATQGQTRNLYSELMRNMSIRSKPDGGALTSVVEQWVSDIDYQCRQGGGTAEDVSNAIHKELRPLQDFVSGYDFAAVIGKYYQGFQEHNEPLMQSALRWLRGEYGTKTEARNDLDVRSIIDDRSVYDYIKLIASFCRMAGYRGLLVCLDEMGVLSHRLNNTQARNSNYEMVLRILNDCLQGNVNGLGFIFAGTDAFLDDKRRGLASYEALATRLADNSFAKDGLKDFNQPVIRLENLSPEDLYVLLSNIRSVQSSGDPTQHLVPDEAIEEFMGHCSRVLGSEFFQTPRDAVKSFVGLLSVLEQNPDVEWKSLLSSTQIEQSTDNEAPDGDKSDTGPSDELASFKL